MPYKAKGKCVYNTDTGEKVGCTKGSVKKYLAALYANVPDAKNEETTKPMKKIKLSEIAKNIMENIPQNQPVEAGLGREVDLDSLVANMDGFTSGNFKDGEELTNDDLEKLQTDNPELHSNIFTNPHGFRSKEYNQGRPVYLK